MIIAITGTPGSGKTTTSRILAKRLNANFIRIRDIINEIPHKLDKKRDTFVVDIKDLEKLVNKKLTADTNIVEGHLAHNLAADVVFVLRTDPKVLERRLKKKGWKKSKITENVKAEILDVITIEALENHENVLEYDTTKKTPRATADALGRVLKKLSDKKYIARYRPGRIDWMKKYRKMLLA